jgi:hypothetical protein
MTPRPQGSVMESWAHEGACDEDVDSIEAIVREGVVKKDDLVKMRGAKPGLPSLGTSRG